jgi:hypothetical protein
VCYAEDDTHSELSPARISSLFKYALKKIKNCQTNFPDFMPAQ